MHCHKLTLMIAAIVSLYVKGLSRNPKRSLSGQKSMPKCLCEQVTSQRVGDGGMKGSVLKRLEFGVERCRVSVSLSVESRIQAGVQGRRRSDKHWGTRSHRDLEVRRRILLEIRDLTVSQCMMVISW